MGIQKLIFFVTVFIGISTPALALQPDTLLCGGSYHGRSIKFKYNPTGASFTYSGADPQDYFLVYIKYAADKKDRLEITTMEFLKDETYEAFKDAVSKIPEMAYLRKPLIHKQVVSLYEGFVDYRIEQDDKVTSFSCIEKSKVEAPQTGSPEVAPQAPESPQRPFGGYLKN